MPSARNAAASKASKAVTATPSKATKRGDASSDQESTYIKFYDVLRYRVVPPIFVVFFTLAAQLLMVQGNPTSPFQWDRCTNPSNPLIHFELMELSLIVGYGATHSPGK
jgi:hypothetical protein